MKTPSVFRRRIFYAATLVVFASSMLVQPFASIASADNQAGPFISDTLLEDVVDRQLLLYMLECVGGQLIVSPDELSSGILTGSKTEAPRGGMFVYETRACNKAAADNGPGEILNRLGITDFVDFFCGLPSVYNTNTGGLGKTIAGGNNKAACKRGVNVPDSFFSTVSSNGNLKQDIITAISKKPRGKDAAGAFRFDKRYVQLWQTWARGCSEARLTNPYPTDSDPAANDPSIFKIPVVNQDGKVKFFVADSGNAKIDSKQVYLAAEYQDPANATAPPGSQYSFYPLPTCGRIAEWMRATADAYGRYLATHKGESGGTTTLPDDSTPTPDAEATTCAVDGIGWIVCPVMQFVGRVNDQAFNFLQSFLGIRPALLVNQAGQTGPHPTYAAWSSFRDIANVAFVIAFLVIVYSQLTSAGISNYGIKKMLPRIIIAAILVNVSYFLCSIAVDVSNVVGSSIYTLLKDSISTGSTISNQGWEDQTSTILAGAATGIFIILLALVIIMAPMTLVAFGMIILILVARQAFVILLIVISPLAFVAYLLPNTETWFKKWWKAFSAVLMVYPVVGVVFGASTLAANILSSTAAGTDDSNLMQLIALGVLAVPLFAVPALLKGSLSAAGSVGARLQGMADRAQGRAGSQAKRNAQEFGKDMKNRFNIAANDSDSRLGKSKFGAYSRWQNRRARGRQDRETAANRAADLRYATDMIGTDSDGNFTSQALRMQKAAAGGVGVANEKAQVRARALATQRTFKQWDDDVSAFQTMQTGLSHEQLALKQTDSNLSAEERAAAAGTIASRDFRAGHNDALAKMHEQMVAADDAHREATAEYQAAVQNGGDVKVAQEKLDRANKELEIQSNIQKQFKGQWKEKSFGMGDSAMGELGEGKYGRIVEREKADGTKVEVRSNDIYTDTRIRAEEKLNEQGLVTMNPDDLNIIVKAAEEDPQSPDALTDSQLRVVTERIAAARANKETNKLIKKDASDKFDRIIAKARSRGIPIPDVPASTPSPEPPSSPDPGAGPTPDPNLDVPH